MAGIDEASGAKTPLGAAAAQGVNTLSYNQEIVFTKFKRTVLPLDGYVFWVRGDLLAPPETGEFTVRGSFHYSTDQQQTEAENFSLNRVVLTALSRIDVFNDVDPNTLYIATYNGIQFSFGARGSYYNQADLWHYIGDAVYPDMQTQLIITADQLTALTGDLIVSNSLPVWLALNTFTPDWPFYPALPLAFPLYPSFLVPANIRPPYGTIHIGGDDTNPLVSAPFFQPTLSQEQSSIDHVRVTLWGCNNAMAANFLATINQFSVDTGLIGIMNRPIPRDEKRTQRELLTIAQKKTIEYDVSYIQENIVDFTRQLITRVIPTFLPQP